jgi:hypothetical protein
MLAMGPEAGHSRCRGKGAEAQNDSAGGVTTEGFVGKVRGSRHDAFSLERPSGEGLFAKC